jgi:hypothetical protein
MNLLAIDEGRISNVYGNHEHKIEQLFRKECFVSQWYPNTFTYRCYFVRIRASICHSTFQFTELH